METSNLAAQVPVVPQIPQKGFYYHYKHDPRGEFNNYVYEVIGLGRNTEEKTYTVLYRPIYKNEWMSPAAYQSRPYDMFFEKVIKDGKEMPRFELITDGELISKLEEVREVLY